MNKFKYALNHKGKLHQFSNSDRLGLFTEVEKFFKSENITFNRGDLLKAIDRQSRMGNPDKKPQRKTLTDVVHGAAAVIKYSVGNCASQEEIQRRSQICLTSGADGGPCGMLASVSQCAACNAGAKLQKFIGSIQAHKKKPIAIPGPVKGKFCGVCQCSLPLLLVTKHEEIIEREDLNVTRPDYCWMKRTSPNFTQE